MDDKREDEQPSLGQILKTFGKALATFGPIFDFLIYGGLILVAVFTLWLRGCVR